jgi:hypothetical protein
MRSPKSEKDDLNYNTYFSAGAEKEGSAQSKDAINSVGKLHM